MNINRSDIATSISLLLILSVGAVIRGASLLLHGTNVLLDLDPFHSLRAIKAIVDTGYLPTFDPLSTAPNGTMNTFATSRGYYEFLGNIAILSGLTPTQALVVSPVIFFLLELLVVFVLAYELSKSRIVALLSSFFMITLTGWSAILVLGGDPVAENLGVVLFLTSILVVTIKQDSYFLVGVLAFIDGITIEVHPVTFYFLNIVLFGIFVTIILQRQWARAKRLALAVLLSTYSIGLLDLSGVRFTESVTFSSAAFWLARLQPNIYTITNTVLESELGANLLILAGISIVVIFTHRVKPEYGLVAWALVLYGVVYIGEFAIDSPYAFVVKYIPFYGPLVLSHRIMPYFPPAICILAAIAIGQFIIPQSQLILKRYGLRQDLLGPIVFLIVIVSFSSQVGVAYSNSVSYSNSFNIAPSYGTLYSWIDNHTSSNAIFVVNDVGNGVGEYIKALANRAVVFTTSEEDLASPDLIQRSTLETCVFLPLCSSNSTAMMLEDYHVNYAIIITNATMVDENSSSFVTFNPSPQALSTYLSWFESRPYFTLQFNDSNAYIFSVGS